MRGKEKPGAATPGGQWDTARRGLLSYDYSTISGPECQALDLAGLWLANAGTLLDDPDLQALSWAAALVHLAQAALQIDPEEATP